MGVLTGIYPANLNLVTVAIAPYGKRDSPTFQHLPIVRYAHYASAMADHSRRNIVVQQLLSYTRLSSTDAVFFISAATFLRHFTPAASPLQSSGLVSAPSTPTARTCSPSSIPRGRASHALSSPMSTAALSGHAASPSGRHRVGHAVAANPSIPFLTPSVCNRPFLPLSSALLAGELQFYWVCAVMLLWRS